MCAKPTWLTNLLLLLLDVEDESKHFIGKMDVCVCI